MNSFAAVVFFAALAAVNAGLIAPLAYSAIPSGHIVQGPSSRTTVVGPDGSAISSVAPGGAIITDNAATIVAQGAPAAVIAPSARLALGHSPLVAVNSQWVGAPAITSYAAQAPLWAHQAIAAPAITSYSAHPSVLSHHGLAVPAISTYGANSPVWSHNAVALPALGRIAAENTVVAGPSGSISQSRAIDAAHATVW